MDLVRVSLVSLNDFLPPSCDLDDGCRSSDVLLLLFC